MPREITFQGKAKQVATEAELLAFANRVREAGGAEVIPALLPSVQGAPKTCLIARALNFDCYVVPIKGGWVMGFPSTRTKEDVRDIARKLGLDVSPTHSYEIPLPEHIGNAAAAFDNNLAFQQYAIESETE